MRLWRSQRYMPVTTVSIDYFANTSPLIVVLHRSIRFSTEPDGLLIPNRKAFEGVGKVASNIRNILVNLKVERKRLLDEQEQLRVSGLPSAGRREGSPYGKREEEATESFELEKRLALAWQIEEQLVDIENTLSKIAAGKYGLCEFCGKPIESTRLQVLPQARECISCKGHHKGHFYSTIQVT